MANLKVKLQTIGTDEWYKMRDEDYFTKMPRLREIEPIYCSFCCEEIVGKPWIKCLECKKIGPVLLCVEVRVLYLIKNFSVLNLEPKPVNIDENIIIK